MRFEIRDDGVRRHAVHLRATGDELEQILRAYFVAVEALRGVWFSAAAMGFQTFQRRYQQLSLELTSSLRTLEGAVGAAGHDYAHAEADQQATVNALAARLGDPADPRSGLPVGERVGDFVDGVADEAGDFVEDVAEDVGEFGDDVGAGIGRIAGGIGGFIGDVAGGAGDLAGDVGSGIGKVVSGDVPGGAGRIAGGIGGFIGDVAGGIGDLAGDVGDGVGRIAEGASDLAGDVAREGGEFARGVGDEVGDLFDGDGESNDPDDGDDSGDGGDDDSEGEGSEGEDDADGDGDGDADGEEGTDGDGDADGDDTQDTDRNGYWENTDGPTPDPAEISAEDNRGHILYGDGDGEGGGHRHDSGVPDKTTFPEDWTDDEIIDNVEDVARNPDEPPVYNEDRETWTVRGTREEHGETVDIEVAVTPEGEVVTGYPTGGDGVHRNDENGEPQPLEPGNHNEGN